MNAVSGLVPAALDSARFGILVERAAFDEDTALSTIVAAVARSAADLIILRTAAGRSDIATALQQQGEFVIHADTLVYHGMPLAAGSGALAPNVRVATAADRDAIALIAAASFQGYRAHYAANPLLPQDKVHAGYVEWAQSRLDDTPDHAATWVVTDGGAIAGFATCDRHGDTVDIVLNAVHPDFERRGHYGRLLGHLAHHYAQQSLQRLIISTQVWNYGVQRQWAKAGLRLYAALDTYHLDRRLARSSALRRP